MKVDLSIFMRWPELTEVILIRWLSCHFFDRVLPEIMTVSFHQFFVRCWCLLPLKRLVRFAYNYWRLTWIHRWISCCILFMSVFIFIPFSDFYDIDLPLQKFTTPYLCGGVFLQIFPYFCYFIIFTLLIFIWKILFWKFVELDCTQ